MEIGRNAKVHIFGESDRIGGLGDIWYHLPAQQASE